MHVRADARLTVRPLFVPDKVDHEVRSTGFSDQSRGGDGPDDSTRTDSAPGGGFNFASAFFSSPGLSSLRPSPRVTRAALQAEQDAYWAQPCFTFLPSEDAFDLECGTTQVRLPDGPAATHATTRPTTLLPSTLLNRAPDEAAARRDLPMSNEKKSGSARAAITSKSSQITDQSNFETPARPRHQSSSRTWHSPDNVTSNGPLIGRSRRGKISDIEAWQAMQERAWQVGTTSTTSATRQRQQLGEDVEEALTSQLQANQQHEQARNVPALGNVGGEGGDGDRDNIKLDGLARRTQGLVEELDGLEVKYKDLFKLVQGS